MTLEVELLNERIRPLLPASLLPRHNPPPKEVILFVELLELLQLRLVLRRTGRTGARPQAAPYWHRPVARSPAWSVRTRAAAREGEHSRSSGSRAPSSPPRHRKGGLLPKGHMHWHEKSACNEGGQSACNPWAAHLPKGQRLLGNFFYKSTPDEEGNQHALKETISIHSALTRPRAHRKGTSRLTREAISTL